MMKGKKKGEKEGTGVYIISVAAELAHCHPQTLRLYERRGLILPSRTTKNRRRYTDRDIERLRHIQELTRERGLNLAGVKMVLEQENEISGLGEKINLLKEKAEALKEELLEEIAKLERSREVSLLKRPTTYLVPLKRVKKRG